MNSMFLKYYAVNDENEILLCQCLLCIATKANYLDYTKYHDKCETHMWDKMMPIYIDIQTNIGEGYEI